MRPWETMTLEREKATKLTSIAIAGAWGYIGRRFLEAAAAMGLRVYVHDPLAPPPDLCLGNVTVIEDESAFYQLPVDLFHLALHPQHRRPALQRLLERTRLGEEVVVLCEKPVALPETPDECDDVLRLASEDGLRLFYDFPELFDPLLHQIVEFLGTFREVRIREMWLLRSKDREDPANPRNHKVMVPIQYQETVHCIAFMLDMVSRFHGGILKPWNACLTVSGESERYNPPNPKCYPRPVDGRCVGEIQVGGVTVHIQTDFKRGAPFTKRRRIVGDADGAPFEVDAEFLEGHKRLRLNGIDQAVAPDANSYTSVLDRLWSWRNSLSPAEFDAGVYPNARMACTAYLVSALLWEACFTGRTVAAHSPNGAQLMAEAYRLHTHEFPQSDTRRRKNRRMNLCT